jgi:hypothetical protein
MLRHFLLLICFVASVCTTASAQKNEVNFMVGEDLIREGSPFVNSPAFSIGYARTIFKGIAVEGALDEFYVKAPGARSDDFGAAYVGALYNFRSNGKGRKFIPYVLAGVGTVSTDFTEVPGEAIYKFGGGVKYYFRSDGASFGIRVELREGFTHRGNQPYPGSDSRIFITSVRAGVTYRF